MSLLLQEQERRAWEVTNMSLIQLGRAKLNMANQGFGVVAKAEAQEIANEMSMDAQKKALQGQTLGTAGGIGAQVGVNKALSATEKTATAIGNINKGIEGFGKAGLQGDKLTFFRSGTTMDAVVGEAAEKAIAESFAEKAMVEASKGAGTTTEVISAMNKAQATGLAEGKAAVDAASAAAAGSSPMATLAQIAAPVAIAMGIGFLLNKIFD